VEVRADGVIRIALCGPFSLSRNGRPIKLRLAGKTVDLLRFLLINAARPSRREYLADLFWGSADHARHRSALSSALWRIRQALDRVVELSLLAEGDAIRLVLGANVQVDAVELARAVDAAAEGTSDEFHVSARLVVALEACDRPFLDGASDDWALVEQERFFELRMRGLALMMRRCGETRRYGDALEFGRRLLAEDPFRESVHCEMMWLYVLSGQRARAIRQYRECETRLRNELGIAPMAELQALRDLILQDFGCDGATHPPAPGNASDAALDRARLDVVFGAIERARQDVYTTLRNQLS
jgi:DNA-binding SARP family transcriptional activator